MIGILGRRLLASNTPKCSQTTDEHKFPWWRVELVDEALVNHVVIFPLSEDTTSLLRSLVVRVGNVDINTTSPDEVFEHNVVCDELITVPQTSRIKIDCNSTAVGRFVSIQITQPCNFEGCLQQEERSLILCEVQVYGNKLRELKSEKEEWINRDSFDAVRQSSTVFDGNADLIFTPGNKKELFSSRTSKACFDFAGNKKTGIYYAYLGDEHKLEKVELKVKDEITLRDTLSTPNKLGYPFIIQFYSVSGKELEKRIPCGQYEGRVQPGSVITIICSSPILGRTFHITVQNTSANPYTDINDILELCEIKLWGNRIINFAQHKSTEASSFSEVEEESFFGVDGYLSGFANGKDIYVRTNASDMYPWWKVDLLTPHLVKEILIFNRKSDILHDIIIRVGNKDIPRKFSATIFEENRICLDLRNSTLDDQPARIRCSSPILGRYVTIQLVTYCNDSTCNEDTSANILTFTEVEVYGIPVDISYFGNLALEEVVRKSEGINLLTDSVQEVAADNKNVGYCWWVLSEKEAVVIQEINLYIIKIFDEKAEFKIQIWVEDEDVTSWAQSEWLTPNDNIVCYQSDSFVFSKPYYQFSCNHLIGRRIYMQYSLNDLNANHSCQNLLHYDVSVWGYKINKDEKVLLSKGESDKWREDPESIAVEPWGLIKSYGNHFAKCTYTAPGLHPYPWWQLKFKGIYKISRVLIVNTMDKYFSRLHDVEIRVGFEDIGDYPLSAPFTQNTLCRYTGSSPVKQKETFIDCDEPVIGIYLTIQITKPCWNPLTCNIFEPTILHLCGVSPSGGEVTDLRPTDINLAEGGSALQSTTSLRAEASLAVDGNT